MSVADQVQGVGLSAAGCRRSLAAEFGSVLHKLPLCGSTGGMNPLSWIQNQDRLLSGAPVMRTVNDGIARSK